MTPEAATDAEFIVIDFDGFNVGLPDEFAQHFMEFDDPQEAIDVANHWQNWIDGADV